MEGKKDYISQMVSDTFDDLEKGNVLYLGKKPQARSGELNQLEMDFNAHKAYFDASRLCVSLDMAGQVVEIPVNWGPFKWIDFSGSSDDLDLKLTSREDIDGLLGALSELSGSAVESLHIFGSQGGLKVEINTLEEGMAAA